MTVSELARLTGVTADAVRYYARRNLLSPRRNRANGYRQFAAFDVRRLRFIRRAQALGFSLAEIATIITQADRGKSPCPMVREIIQTHIREAGQELELLIALRDRMRKALAKWSRMPDGMPNGHEICRLIEAADLKDDGSVGRMVSATRRVKRHHESDRTSA